MEFTEQFFQDALKTDESIEANSSILSREINNGKITISKFVEQIGFALTSQSVDQRVKGTQILSATLTKLPKDFLNNEEVSFVFTFFCDRLKDHHNVIPAVIDGITALISMDNVPKECPMQFLSSFFQNTTVQSQTRDDRAKLLSILEALTKRWSEELKTLGGDFVYNVINSIDGERDTRNVDFIFTFMPGFCKTFPLLHLAEEMFESFACYFPIDFNPSRNDGRVITREDLAEKLADCLVASEEFFEWDVALIVEKLESDLTVAKVDSLNLLSRCSEAFSSSTITPYFEQLWLQLKNQLLSGTDNSEVMSSALKALLKLLENATNSTDQSLSKSYQTQVLGTILPILGDANHRLFNAASSVALVCVSADPAFASEKILSSFYLILEGDSCKTEEKTKILAISSQIFRICSVKKSLKSINTPETEKLHARFLELLKDKETSLSVLLCLQECLPIVNEDFRKAMYSHMIQVLTNDDEEVDISTILWNFAKFYPQELHSECIEKVLRNLPIFQLSVKAKIYQNLSSLVNIEHFEKPLLETLLFNIFENPSINEQILALNALEEVLSKSNSVSKLDENFCIVESILKNATKASNVEVLENFMKIICLVVKNCSLEEQIELTGKYLPNLNLNSTSDLYLTKGLLGNLHKDVSMDEHFEKLITDLMNTSLKSDDEGARKVAHLLICSLVNKVESKSANKSYIRKIVAFIKEEIKKGDKKAVELLSWIAKGLLVKGDEDAADIVEDLAKLLDHPTLSEAAVLAFDVISFEYPGLHLPVVKFLFKQKLFHIVLKKIWDKLEAFSEHHLKAFGYVVLATPHSVLKMNIEKVRKICYFDLCSKQLVFRLDQYFSGV
ncbi:MMS19 family protein [Megaselia abdita]